MFICVCKQITDTQIRQAVADGATTFEEVSEQLGVSTQCGSCEQCARDLVKREVTEIGYCSPDTLAV